jgi:hypothetical protein
MESAANKNIPLCKDVREGTKGRPSKQRHVVHMLAARCSRWLPPYPDAGPGKASGRAAPERVPPDLVCICMCSLALTIPIVPSYQIADKTCFGAGRCMSERGARSRTGSTSVSAENGRLDSTFPYFPKGQELSSPQALAPFCCVSDAFHATVDLVVTSTWTQRSC